MDASDRLAQALNGIKTKIVVDFDAGIDRLFKLDLSANNTQLNAGVVADIKSFNCWLDQQLADNHCRYAIGGYMELRTIYDSRPHFNESGEPRRLHLGVDIWAPAGTPVYAPLNGAIHSFKDNDNFGDYGPTIILQHQLNGLTFYSLYGHLSRRNLPVLHAGDPVTGGQQIANFGDADENGNWPPHLHFQLMLDMQDNSGDYPGACRLSEKESYLQNIPDPALLLRFPANSII